MRILILGLSASLLVLTTPAQAQTDPVDQGSGVQPVGFLNILSCIDIIGGLTVDPDCVHQKQQESQGVQQVARATNRYWQMSLMAASQMYAGLQWAKDSYQTWRGTDNILQAVIAGFLTEEPARKAYLLDRSTNRLMNRLNQHETLLQQFQTYGMEDRFELVNTATMEALDLADRLDAFASSLSERAVEMQMRLGEVDMRNVSLLSGDTPVRLFSESGLPPGYGDNDETDDLYAMIYNMQPRTVSGAPLRSSAGPQMAGPNGETMICPFEALGEDDPETVFLWAQIMASGVAMGAEGISVQANTKLETLNAISDLEVIREREIEYFHTLRAFRNH